MRVKILQDGRIEYLYSDECPLNALGTLSVERASDVYFDQESQRWRVRNISSGEDLLDEGFVKRADAIRAEVAALEKEMG